MRQQMVSERDGLRGTCVGGAGHDRLDVFARPGDERPHEHRGQALDAAARGEQPQPQIGDDQVVAAAASVQPRPHVPQPVRDPAFDRRMHVLVRLIERELSFRDPAAHVRERLGERGGLVRRQQTRLLEAVHVRDRCVDVVGCQTHVELHAPPKGVGLRRGRRREPSGPERLAGAGASGPFGLFGHAPPCFADHTLSGSP